MKRVNMSCHCRQWCFVRRLIRPSYLELGTRVGRIRCAQPQHVHQTASRPCPYTPILVSQQVRMGQFLGDLCERVAIILLLLHVAKLFGQSLQSP